MDMSPIGMSTDQAPAALQHIPGPRLRRQVWLENEAGERLGYAVSWWPEHKWQSFLQDASRPVGSSIALSKRELFRDVLHVFSGSSKVLETHFGHEGPFWGRYYLFHYQGEPLTLIYEVFSPQLEKHLGQVLIN